MVGNRMASIAFGRLHATQTVRGEGVMAVVEW